GPCPPLSESSNVVDLETVLLHELGHGINLGHIIDPLQGSGAGTATPAKVMHYSIAYNQRRISIDIASKTGALYLVTRHGYTFGNCTTGDPEMSPLQTIVEAKDDCPASFPVSSMPTFTKINFDLAHATSNKLVDPAYNQWKKDGTGTNVTNTAFYAFKTNATGGTLVMEVMNYTTSPAAVAACDYGSTGVLPTGVKVSTYKVPSCPAGGSFPVPIDYQTFKTDGMLTTVPALSANSTYLIAVDGIQNTKAIFDIEFTGTALPLQSTELNGAIVGDHNELTWTTNPAVVVSQMVLERSEDGINFQEIQQIVGTDEQQSGQYSDVDPLPGNNYYRMRVESPSGTIQYSEVVTLNRSDNGGFTIDLVTNASFSQLKVIIQNSHDEFGTYGALIVNSLGQQVLSQTFTVSTRTHEQNLQIAKLASGIYYIKVFGNNGEKIKAAAFMKM
ncbi:MAG TPA: T9SS type A sorting domain-containing protein, partial [Flavitalea sp.]|nr:T9SS type A sorting domain-containing protein [Flavitalea sp.]